MPAQGKKQAYNESHITAPAAYRLGVTGADATGATGLSALTGTTGYFTCLTEYPAEMNLWLYFKLSGATTTATVQIWFCPDSSPTTGNWYFKEKIDITRDGYMHAVSSAAPGYYKILVTSLAVNASLDIYYQYRD